MPTEKPNVLLVTADHWPAALLGVAGHPSVRTPTLDQLALNGTRFTNAYAECPVCIPARRTLMTGTQPRTHGDRVYKDRLRMPAVPTLAQTFRDAGYQAAAVGKLHVFPQRDRIGFDDVILCEEGRMQYAVADDYELFLAERGHAGEFFGHGMSNNEYHTRAWHLPENLHVTHWATRNMCRTIQRRDPTRPGFWYLSYMHPHPPLVPLQAYLDLYREVPIDEPVCGEWARDPERIPYLLRARQRIDTPFDAVQVRAARRAFYALCTHIDHQLRLVIGTLREEGLVDNTIVCFSSDHGDVLGDHGVWAKRTFLEGSANIPMIVAGAKGGARVPAGAIDDRLVGWADVMPTLLELASVEVPATVEGCSMFGERKREHFYGECGEGLSANRMVRDARYKLIYYPVGNRVQLFDLQQDPRELNDLAEVSALSGVRERLTEILIEHLYGEDEAWVQGGKLAGLPDRETPPPVNRGLTGQRGTHWPLPSHAKPFEA
ncbi:MAG: sulfatase-like hydrolase/transferase [Planctomycetes bacterium]|nr:sulfatase-like hydrolase/transferase [Planctomycetota bacterium]